MPNRNKIYKQRSIPFKCFNLCFHSQDSYISIKFFIFPCVIALQSFIYVDGVDFGPDQTEKDPTVNYNIMHITCFFLCPNLRECASFHYPLCLFFYSLFQIFKYTIKQCCGSVTFWYGSESGSADPAIFVSDQDGNKKYFFCFLLITFRSYIYINFQR
jgi:hypothetical protein